MTSDQYASLARSALKILGAMLVAHGVTDSGTVETITGGLVALIGLVLSLRHHAPDPAPSTSASPSVTDQPAKPSVSDPAPKPQQKDSRIL